MLVLDQLLWAFFAAATASSRSCLVESGTSALGSPVAGLLLCLVSGVDLGFPSIILENVYNSISTEEIDISLLDKVVKACIEI